MELTKTGNTTTGNHSEATSDKADKLNTGFRHIIPLQIRFNDVDKFGHVNNTVFFQFYDTAKTDYFATVCKDVDWEQMAIIVAHIEADFVAQVKADNHIAGRTRVTHIGHKSFRLEQELFDIDTNEVKSRCISVMVLYDLHQRQTIPLPEKWVKDISKYDNIEE
ncbi:MAG: acyl-CoA thioesterase [Bacteroidaceae bacterium]|nr:acyl-CoA thioesterase [Bacteroidaceae bacterium]